MSQVFDDPNFRLEELLHCFLGKFTKIDDLDGDCIARLFIFALVDGA